MNVFEAYPLFCLNLPAEAASLRFARAPDVVPEDCAQGPLVVHVHEVSPLVQLVIRNVCGRICDSRNPIFGMQGIPVDVAMKVVEYLIKEKLLRPKTLQLFVSW